MKQKERTHFLSPFREEERKSERRLSFFILFLPQTEWRISPFPEKRKEKKKKMRRWKNAGRRKKDKNEDGRKEGKRIISPHDGNAGKTAHLPAFSLPIRISKHGKSGTQNQPILPPLPRHHAEALPSPIVDVSSFSYVVYFNAFIWYHIHVTKEEKRRKKKC